MFMEIIGATVTEANRDEAYAWVVEMGRELRQKGLELKGGYVSLKRAEERVKECFGG